MFDLRAHGHGRYLEAREDMRSETLLLAKQAKQYVLGADVFVPEAVRLLLCEIDRLLRRCGEALNHRLRISVGRGLRNRHRAVADQRE
jgi:hypothetical protein